ncbi:MAG TPA: signal peptidase I [Firmicutes bacterium]|nr:signal peptidase I [Bacillota bacterium]HHY97878.1 signal peptidase I [Bacillota bacterium]
MKESTSTTDKTASGERGGHSTLKSEVLEYVQAFVVAIILAAFIITFVAQSFVVQGSSMEPTLHNGERLLVNKFIYRFAKPARGQIVVFRFPADPRRKFIKRVIGVAGDEILIRNSTVFLNGEPLEEGYILDSTLGDWGPEVVPDGRIFVLGDNRNNSEDSRFSDVGFVPLRNVVGQAFLIYWPPGRMGLIRNPLTAEASE